jgi:transposase
MDIVRPREAFTREYRMEKLPTACPELNPAERVFEELRKFLANRVFENKEEIEACLIYWIKDFQQKSAQLIKFHWM